MMFLTFSRSFDFEVETKAGIQHVFSSIEKGEYPKLFDFITAKSIRVKNRGKMVMVNLYASSSYFCFSS